ncbi:MAG: GvpL/GvpF family gas vesicle protein [Pyrinomonadaceae bacterium]|nr:GvpL/GvpF family gas vesicle protein [Pyrinomonadaceae bacterium]
MFYAYCLSDEVTERMIAGVQGIGGIAPRLFQLGEIAAVVSELHEEGAPVVTRENVLAHERVLECVLAQTTPLPFRFGTMTGAERLQNYVASQERRLKAALARVRSSVEMSVKIIWNLEEIKREELAQEAEAEGHGKAAGAGTQFLLAKRREIIGDERLKMRAGELQAWLDKLLKDVVKESSSNVRPAEALVLSASHLVEREQLESYRERLAAARGQHQELRFLTSGPWPPYSFSDFSS